MNLNITIKIDPNTFPKKWKDSDKVQEKFLEAIQNALDTALEELDQQTNQIIPDIVESTDRGRDTNGWDFEFKIR